MADTLPHPNFQDFAPTASITQSPAASCDDLPSSVPFHASCRTCHHWFNKQTIPYPLPKYVKCPKCHTKLFCFGTQSSQETFMTQATDVPSYTRRSVDLASIESILSWSPHSGSSERIVSSVRLPRVRTEPALNTMATAPVASGQPLEHQTEAEAPSEQDSGRMPQENAQDNVETAYSRNSEPIDAHAAEESHDVNPSDGSQEIREQSRSQNGHAVLESVPRDAQPTASEDTLMITSEEPKIMNNSMPRSTRLVIKLPRKISSFIKTKFRYFSGFRRRHQNKRNITLSESPALQADKESVIITTTAPTQSHRDSQDSARVVEAVRPSQQLLAASPKGSTDHARARAISEPHDMSHVGAGIPTAPTKDEYRQQVRQENSRKARKRESKHRRCPCWPDCQCFPDVPRLQVQRSNTLLSRSLTDVPSVRDLLRTDSFYREIQHLAQQARGQRDGRGSSGFNQAQRTPSQAPSQDASWNSLGTTEGDNSGSVDLTASIQGDAPRQNNYVQAPYLNTNVDTETLVDEDQNPTPRQEQPDGVDFESADDMLRGVGEVHHDSNNTQTDEANQRN